MFAFKKLQETRFNYKQYADCINIECVAHLHVLLYAHDNDVLNSELYYREMICMFKINK